MLAVWKGGRLTVSCGSLIDTLAAMQGPPAYCGGPPMAILFHFSVWVMIDQKLPSVPVPEVVGMAISGRGWIFIFRKSAGEVIW